MIVTHIPYETRPITFTHPERTDKLRMLPGGMQVDITAGKEAFRGDPVNSMRHTKMYQAAAID